MQFEIFLSKERRIMARKVQITKDFLIDTAFKMTREEGLDSVTARKLATRAECSTQPIFRLYENMEELYGDIFKSAWNFFSFFYKHFPKDETEPFVNLGLAYIRFAEEEKELFRLLFIPKRSFGKSTYEILNGDNGVVVSEIEKARGDGCKNTGELFTKMWIFVHGAACMAITGDYDLGDAETKKLLKETYMAFK